MKKTTGILLLWVPMFLLAQENRTTPTRTTEVSITSTRAEDLDRAIQKAEQAEAKRETVDFAKASESPRLTVEETATGKPMLFVDFARKIDLDGAFAVSPSAKVSKSLFQTDVEVGTKGDKPLWVRLALPTSDEKKATDVIKSEAFQKLQKSLSDSAICVSYECCATDKKGNCTRWCCKSR